MDENPRLTAGWPFDPTAEFTATWERIEQRAGRNICQKERVEMHAAGILFSGCAGRPPHRVRFIFTYWSLYLRWMTQKKREKNQNA